MAGTTFQREFNQNLSSSAVLIRPATGTSFAPLTTVWTLHLTCSAAGSATVTLSGVRRDTGVTETVATYSLLASQSLFDGNDKIDYSSFSWASTGTGVVTVEVF